MDLNEIKDNLIKHLGTPLIGFLLASLIALGLLWSIWSNIENLWLRETASVTTAFRPHAQINVDRLQDYHLMGSYAANLKDLPLASLGVTLVGIFSDSDGQSTALITMSGGDSESYHVGDQLAPNVVIKRILAKSVIVKHNGRLEKLEMPIQAIVFKTDLPQSGLWQSNSNSSA